MRLGNFTQNEILTCDFYQYGSKQPNQPGILAAREENPWGQGSARWSWQQLMDTGVDVEVLLREPYFVDHVSARFAEGNAPERVVLLVDGDAVWGQASGENITFSVAKVCRSLKIRLLGGMRDVVLEALRIGGCLDREAGVYPVPYHTQKKPGGIGRRDLGRVVYDETDAAQALAARLLTEKAGELGLEGNGHIPVILKKEGDLAAESYRLLVTEEQVVVAAGERKGFLYGVSRLWQLLLRETVPCCEIRDKPFKALRGFHMGLPPREEIGFYQRLIRDLLVPMGYNTLFLQITAGMRFRKHPELNEAWVNACRKSDMGEWPVLPHGDMIAGGGVLEQEEVAGLVEYARQYGLEVIPEIQSLGHVQYITLAHPELAEISPEEEAETVLDERKADRPPRDFYKHCYCPSNEESYKLMFDIIDEVVDVVKPSRYVHMGHDEVYQIGLCPKCRQTAPWELFARDVGKLYDHLKEKGLGMMIWSDMIQPDSGYKTTRAIDLLPRDIVMLDFIWYFHLDQDLEDHLLKKGYPVAVGNLYSSHYPRYEHRIRKERMLGGEVSTWCRPDEYVLGREGKLYDLLYTAGMLWSERYDGDYRETYNRMIKDLLPWVRARLHGKGQYPSLRAGAAEKTLSLAAGSRTVISRQAELNFEKWDFSQACQLSRESAAEYAGEDRAWEGLAFYHASLLHEGRLPYSPLKKIGQYTIEFADGSCEPVSVEYGGNIGSIGMRYAAPLPDAYFRHTGYTATYFTDPVEGKTAEGRDQTLYRLEWINSEHKKIRRIRCEAEDCGGILLAGIRGITAEPR